jgi:hypothetical protein
MEKGLCTASQQEVSSFYENSIPRNSECSLIQRELKKKLKNLFMQLSAASFGDVHKPPSLIHTASDGWIADTAREAKRN